jgi:hypothetical protein
MSEAALKAVEEALAKQRGVEESIEALKEFLAIPQGAPRQVQGTCTCGQPSQILLTDGGADTRISFVGWCAAGHVEVCQPQVFGGPMRVYDFTACLEK